MHDPLVVAFHIRRPWPQRQAQPFGKTRWRFRGTFWNIAGRGIYWPPLITVWHVEPHGADALRGDCRGTRWRWHIHHWKVQVHPLQHLRRSLLTRCVWCGGRSRKGDPVNISHSWGGPRGRWWQGEPGLFHEDCSAIQTAHRTCICGRGPWESVLAGWGYGRCANCGNYREWRSDERRDPIYPKDRSDLLLASVPVGQRDPAKIAQVRAWWCGYLETTTTKEKS